MDLSACDVLVVGGGGAGLRAAIAVAETHPDLQRRGDLQGLPDAQPHGLRGGRAPPAVIKSGDSLDEHAYDTISGGDWLCDQDAVEVFVREAPQEMLRLEHWGCPWSREPDGHVAVRPFGGMKIERTWFAADKTGFHMLHALFQTSLKYDGHPALRRVVRHEAAGGRRALPGGGGHRAGARGRSRPSPPRPSSCARAAAARSSRSPPTPPSRTATAWRSPTGRACRSRTWSSSSTIPPGCPFTGILITEAARAEGGMLLNKDGYRYLQDYDLGKPEPKPVLRLHGAGPARSALAGLRQGAGEGADHQGAVRGRRPPGHPPPGREDDRQEDPVRAGAVPEVRGHRPGAGRRSRSGRSSTT